MFNIGALKKLSEKFIKKEFPDNIKSLSDIEFFLSEILNWENSISRQEQLTGQRYYEGVHDIKNRKRTAIGEGGRLISVDNLPNNKIIDNQYAKAVDQKVNYLLGNPAVMKADNECYTEKLNWILDKVFFKTMQQICRDSLNCGIGWLYVYYDENGELSFKRFKPFDIIPFWKDESHNELDYVIRIYPVVKYIGKKKTILKKVEIYSISGIKRYILSGGKLTEDKENPSSAYVKYSDGKNIINLNWDKIPIIPFKYNSEEIPLIRRCKELQDSINEMFSDFMNNIQEDSRNTILVIKNYDGTDLGEFRRNLASYGAVKVRSIEGADGGIETLNINVNSDNYKAIINELKKALIENAKSFDSKDDRLSGQANQMNIQSMYSDIDIDSKGMEVEYLASFDKLLWFVDKHLYNTGIGDFSNEKVNITFNKNILMNETDAVNNTKNSMGVISNETMLSHHPWVDDVKEELERLKNENEENMSYYSQPLSSEHINTEYDSDDKTEEF